MARIEVTMPKMGESIMEGTVVEWSKKVGDSVEQDETLLEIATDKVDSEVPSPEAGILVEILVQEGETVDVGAPIAILETDADAAKSVLADGGVGDESEKKSTNEPETVSEEKSMTEPDATSEKVPDKETGRVSGKISKTEAERQPGEKTDRKPDSATPPQRKGSDGRFFSPLVRAIAREEGISREELESLKGSGNQGRVTKQDVLDYVASGEAKTSPFDSPADEASSRQAQETGTKPSVSIGDISAQWPDQNVEIIKMDRMRKVISEHMIRSRQTSAHVTTFGEADVTRLVQFREKHKEKFLKKNGFKLTFTPFFVEATIRALQEFPLLNSSVDGDNIVLKRSINYGIAVALGEAGTGGLIVPVIKNAGEMNLQGLARQTHILAQKARSKQLSPDDLVGGTFTLTNYGSVGNLMGTPIINQPQVAIFGTGIIQKRPVVIEVEGSDTIAIRHMVYLSMSYDHRIIDGAMGGSFVQRVKQLLENFDMDRSL